MPTLTAEEAKAKDARAMLRQCMDEEITHLRCGGWRGPVVKAVEFVGMVADLHGTVCSCCPRRRVPVAAPLDERGAA